MAVQQLPNFDFAEGIPAGLNSGFEKLVRKNRKMQENSQIDKKSLRVLTKANPDWNELAKDAVCFANAYGGHLLIGIEDDADAPPAQQTVPVDLVSKLVKNIQQRTLNVSVIPQVCTHENGGEYLDLLVQRTASTLASTSSGKYFIRVEDDCKPVMPDELPRLIADKSAFVWELQSYLKVPRTEYDENKVRSFLQDVQQSSRVSTFVKDKSRDEILEHYFFIQDGYLTNLGVLWIGKRIHRAKLLYSPSIQYLKYDEQEEKVNKLVWDDHSLNPKELIESIWQQVPDWKEGIEIEDGLFRHKVANYDEVVVRELLANALVHRPYTIRGDIFINLYPDRMEIHNPGTFPLGVTPQNILHKSVQRNTHLAKVFYDLKLMEKEGSGYDKIYATLLSAGKPLPQALEERDRVSVTVEKRIVRREVIRFMETVGKHYDLRLKEVISLGLIAQNTSLTAIEFARILDLDEANGVRHWLGKLLEIGLVKQKGRTKGTTYFVDPELLKTMEYQGPTDLKNIAVHRLRALIREDLGIYGNSAISEIHQRIGKEIPLRSIKSQLDNLMESGEIDKEGQKRGTKYFINDNL